MLKKCVKCEVERKIDEFYKNKNTKDGRYPYCSYCCAQYRREHIEDRKTYDKQRNSTEKYKEDRKKRQSTEKYKIKQRAKLKKNMQDIEYRNKKNEYERKWYAIKCHEGRRRYRQTPIAKERARERYSLRDKTERQKYLKEYYSKNKEEIRAQMRIKYQSEEVKKKCREYSRKKKKTDLQFKIACSLRTRFWQAVKGKTKKGSAVKLLGCSIESFKEYFATKFKEGMTWENHGTWHIDHIQPLASFNLEDPEHLVIACHYTNLQPLWAKENIQKGAKICAQN